MLVLFYNKKGRWAKLTCYQYHVEFILNNKGKLDTDWDLELDAIMYDYALNNIQSDEFEILLGMIEPKTDIKRAKAILCS